VCEKLGGILGLLRLGFWVIFHNISHPLEELIDSGILAIHETERLDRDILVFRGRGVRASMIRHSCKSGRRENLSIGRSCKVNGTADPAVEYVCFVPVVPADGASCHSVFDSRCGASVIG
jgi:hypothetical protein